MAEVTGYFGAEAIELNNAATEATLKQLVAAVTLLAAKSGKGSAADKEVEKLAKAMLSGEKEVKKLTKTQKAEAEQRKKNTEAAKAFEEAEVRAAKKTAAAMDAIDGLSRATVSAASKLTGMISTMANMGNSFSGAAGALGQVPLVGGLLGPVFGAIGAAGDKVYNSFIQTSSVGANFNGSIRGMIKAASDSGMTIDQFTGIIAKNSDNLRFLGGTTAEGAKQLAALGKRLRTENRPLMNSLAGLGYSTEEISTGMVRFGSMMARSGKQLDQKALVESSGQYLKNLDAMAKLTGKSKDALQSEHDARMAESDFRLFSLKLDEKGVLASQMALDLVPKQFQGAAQELLATGIPKSDAAKALFKQMPELAQNLVKMGQQAKRSGTLTEQQVLATDKAAQAEARRNIELSKAGQGATEVLGQFGNATDKAMASGVAELAVRGDAQKALADTTKTMQDAANSAGKALSPAQMMEAQQAIAIQSNKMSELLAARMPELTDAFTKLVNLINGPLMTAFNFMMDNIGKIALAVGVAAGALAGIKMFFKGKELFDTLFGRGLGTKGNPMHVTMGGAGGLDDMLDGSGDGKSKRRRDKKGRFRKATKLERAGDFLKKVGPSAKTAGKFVKGGALIGAGMAAYDAYDTFQDVDKQVAEGKMSKDEAKKAKTVAGSTAVGSASGGFAGAAAGAALGTLIFPGVGTIIGGAIGGALGAWGGEAAGAAVGEALTKADPSKMSMSNDSKKKANDWAWAILNGKASLSQVPIGLQQTVAGIIKNPPSTWTKKLEEKKSSLATPKAPIATSLSAAQKDMSTSIINKANEQKLVKDQTSAAALIPPSKPLTGQESSESLLAGLNTKMDAMLKLNARFVDLASRQLSATSAMSGNLIRAV